MSRDYLLPITERERELLAGIGIADLDLARRVNLVPVKDGWVRLRLTEAELKALIWVACQAREGPVEEALKAAVHRMGRVLRGSPALPDPAPRPVTPLVAMDEVDLPLTAADRNFLTGHPEVLEDLPPALSGDLTARRPGPVRVLFGEALLLVDRLNQVGMSPEVPDPIAHTVFNLAHRIEAALDGVWRRASRTGPSAAKQQSRICFLPVTVGLHQRIPVALRQSELEFLQGIPGLLSLRAAGLLPADVQLAGPRILVTLDEVEELLTRLAELEETEELRRLENRLDQVLRGFQVG